jgi:hypothetical protein
MGASRNQTELRAWKRACSESISTTPVHLDATVPIPKTIQFFCTQDYDRHACLKDSNCIATCADALSAQIPTA